MSLVDVTMGIMLLFITGVAARQGARARAREGSGFLHKVRAREGDYANGAMSPQYARTRARLCKRLPLGWP